MPKTNGISPKVLAQLVAGAVTYVLAKFSIHLSPELAASIAAVLGGAAGLLAGPGDITHAPTAAELQQVDAMAAAARQPTGPEPVPPPVMPAPPA